MSYTLYAAEVNDKLIDEVYYRSLEEIKAFIKSTMLDKVKDIVNFHGKNLISIDADTEKYEIKYKVVTYSAKILEGSYTYKIVEFKSN